MRSAHSRVIDAFRYETVIFRPGGNVVLPLPKRAYLAGIVDGRLLVTLNEPWEAAPGLRFATDSVVSYDLAEWKKDPAEGAAVPGLGARGRARP